MHTHSIMHTYMHTYIIYICLQIYLCVYISHTYHRTRNYRTTLFLMKEYQWRDHLKWLFLAEFTNYRTMYTDALISHGMRHVLPQPRLMSPSTLAGCSCRTPCSSPGSWLQRPCPYSPAPALAARTRSTSAALPPPGELWAEPHQTPWKWTVMHRREEHGRWFLPSSSSFTSFICLEFLSKEIYLFPSKASHSILCDRNKWIEKNHLAKDEDIWWQFTMFPHLFSDDIRGAAPVSRISLFYWKQSSFISSQRSKPLFFFLKECSPHVCMTCLQHKVGTYQKMSLGAKFPLEVNTQVSHSLSSLQTKWAYGNVCAHIHTQENTERREILKNCNSLHIKLLPFHCQH